jgi:hypothetical protein
LETFSLPLCDKAFAHTDEHLIDIVVGIVAGILVVIIGAITWMKCSGRNRNRYRAIG